MAASLTFLIIALYLAAGILLARRLGKGIGASASSKQLPLGLGLAGILLHAFLLYGALFTPQGLNLAFFNVLSLISGLIALLILLASIRRPVENLAILALPLASFGVVLQVFFPSNETTLIQASPGIQFHILLSVLSYSLLSIAAVQAGLLAIQNHHLRDRHPGGFIRALPPLETMETLLFQMIAIGFTLLTLALLSGAAFLEDMFAQHLVHKTVLSLVAWLVFAVLLRGRWKYGWRGRTAIRWTLGGFIALLLAYFGSKLVLELILA